MYFDELVKINNEKDFPLVFNTYEANLECLKELSLNPLDFKTRLAWILGIENKLAFRGIADLSLDDKESYESFIINNINVTKTITARLKEDLNLDALELDTERFEEIYLYLIINTFVKYKDKPARDIFELENDRIEKEDKDLHYVVILPEGNKSAEVIEFGTKS